MLHFITWDWGIKYGPEYIQNLAASLHRNVKQEYRLSVFTDKDTFPAKNVHSVFSIPQSWFHLLGRGCFIRLQMFDPSWQAKYEFTDRIVGIDLDSVITGPLDPLFDRPEPFVILQGANMFNPCPFNGALTMLRVGMHPEVWDDFSIEAAHLIPQYEWPDDQGWIWHKLPDAAGWSVGPESGVYVYKKKQWPEGEALPAGARLVTFVGKKNPKDLQHLDWVKDNWK